MARLKLKNKEDINPAFRWRDVPRAIWYFLEGDRVRFVTLSIILFIIFLYDFVPAFLAGKIVDVLSVSDGDVNFSQFYFLVILLGVSFTIASMIRYWAKRNLQNHGHNMRARARIQGFEKLTEHSMQWHAQENSGNKVQRIYTGSDSLLRWAEVLNRDILRIGSSIIAVIFLFSFVHWQFVLFIIFYIGIFLAIEFFYDKKLVRLSSQFNTLNQTAGGVYIEGAGNMLAIKALGTEHSLQTKVRNAEEKTRDLSVLKNNTNFRKWGFFRIIDGPAFIIFFLLIGHSALLGVVSAGYVMTLFIYFYRLREVMNDISVVNERVIDYKADLGHMMTIFWEKTHVMTGKEKFPHDWKNISIKKATLAYPSGQIGLDKLDLQINRGEKLGIAGSSGGGKSTLVKLLLGLYKLQTGDFIVGNRNYYEISHEDLIHQLSVVLQETELFNISLRENITMMREENPELLQKAIEISQLEDVIAKLPDGVDTLIGERGYMLSGGERQRLGIARAIYKNSEIMIFDEATSSLDSETERKIMEGLLGDFGKSRTMIIVAHRLSTLANTNRVAVFEEGTIVEEGTYHDLLANDESILSKLSKTQVTPPDLPL